MAPHSSTLAWKIPWTEEPGRLQSMGSLRVRHDWATSLSLSCIGGGNGNPLQYYCLENPRDGEPGGLLSMGSQRVGYDWSDLTAAAAPVFLCNPMACNPPGSSVPGDSPGKNAGVGCHALLQGIFPTQGSNPGLPHCRRIFFTAWATREAQYIP